MYHICESLNFMWSTQDYLGEGATATVYRGVSKLNGDFVAVKCYKSYISDPEYQFREFDMLKQIKHENIVKLIAIEENQVDRRKVIVTELCTGGSLLVDILDPKNTYGLEESEFLLVLRHLYGGMKYLRDKNIVHRDLKPGSVVINICLVYFLLISTNILILLFDKTHCTCWIENLHYNKN